MQEIEFTATVRRPYPPFYAAMFHLGQYKPEYWKDIINSEYAMTDLMIIDGVWYYSNDHLYRFAKELVQRLFNDEKIFLKMKAESLRREEKIKSSISGNVENFCKAYTEYMPTIGIYFVCDDYIEAGVRELLKGKCNELEISQLMDKLVLPLEDNYYIKEKLELANPKDLEEHVKKFAWLHTRYGIHEEYPVEKAKKLSEELVKENFLEKYSKQKEEVKNAIKNAKEILGEEKHTIDLMQFFIFYRTQRTDVINMCMYRMIPKLTEYAKAKGITYEELLYCTREELESNMPQKGIIKERMRGFSLIGNEEGYKVVSGEENERVKQKYSQFNNKANGLKGNTAYAGTIIGRAKIILNQEDIVKINPGDILVSTMTTPNLITAMNKAAAFVTDEGGITCHASIVAREMKKPCIIGTRHATKILKDGDLIKVDGESGKVTILEERKDEMA